MFDNLAIFGSQNLVLIRSLVKAANSLLALQYVLYVTMQLSSLNQCTSDLDTRNFTKVFTHFFLILIFLQMLLSIKNQIFIRPILALLRRSVKRVAELISSA